MTDLSKLAAERCAELANGIRPNDKFWRAASFEQENGSSDMIAFRKFVEQAHTLATEALAHPERAAEILAPLILVEPVDADLLIAREVAFAARKNEYLHFPDELGCKLIAAGKSDNDPRVQAALAAIRLYRQREGGGNG